MTPRAQLNMLIGNIARPSLSHVYRDIKHMLLVKQPAQMWTLCFFIHEM